METLPELEKRAELERSTRWMAIALAVVSVLISYCANLGYPMNHGSAAMLYAGFVIFLVALFLTFYAKSKAYRIPVINEKIFEEKKIKFELVLLVLFGVSVFLMKASMPDPVPLSGLPFEDWVLLLGLKSLSYFGFGLFLLACTQWVWEKETRKKIIALKAGGLE